MPHFARIVKPREHFQSLAANKLPDPDLPLIHRGQSSTFVRPLDDGRRAAGTVFPQRRSARETTLHRTLFYVEFPADSGTFFEINASRMVRHFGIAPARQAFTAAEVATILDTLHPSTDVTAVLRQSKPI